MDRQEILEELKNVLAHLNDVAMLSDSPLAQLMPAASGGESVSRGVHLRGLLIELIENMQPSVEVPENAPEWRQYLILRDRYVMHRPLWEIEHKLVVGEKLRRGRRAEQGASAMGLVINFKSVPLGQCAGVVKNLKIFFD